MRSRNSVFEKYLTLLDQALVSGSNFLIGILVAREFGAGSVTKFTLVMSSVYYLNSVQHSFVFSYLYSRNYSVSKFRLLRMLNVQSVITFFSLVLLSVFLCVFVFLSVFEIYEALVLLFFCLSLNFYEYIRRIRIYERKLITVILWDIIVKIGPLGFLFLSNNKEIMLFFLIALVLVLFSLFYSFVVSGKVFGASGIKSVLRYGANFKRVYKFGVWLWLGASLQWTSGYAYLYGAAAILGGELAGYVIAIKNLFGFSSVIFQFYESYVPPRAPKDGSATGTIAGVVKLSLESFFGLLLLVILVNVFSGEIIKRVYGVEFESYVYLVIPFSILVLLEYLQRPLLLVLRIFNQTKVVFKAYLLNTFLGLFTVYPVVYFYREMGVAIGLLGLQIAMLTMYIYHVLRLNSLSGAKD